jgi:hypothetical protein
MVVALRTPAARLWVALLAAKLVFLIGAAIQFYPHYAAWVAPEMALLGGVAVAMAGGRLRAIQGPLRAAFAAGLVAMASVSIAPTGERLAPADLARAVRHADCVAADAPTLLIAADALRRNLHHACPMLLNPGGLYHLLNVDLAGPSRPRPDLAAYQAAMVAHFGGADAALFVRLDRLELTDASRAAIRRALPFHERVGAVTVRTRAEADEELGHGVSPTALPCLATWSVTSRAS